MTDRAIPLGMARDKQARRSATGAMAAWANLVGAIVLTMIEEQIERAAVHRFLDHLDRANETVLGPDELDFSYHVIGTFRAMVPGND